MQPLILELRMKTLSYSQHQKNKRKKTDTEQNMIKGKMIIFNYDAYASCHVEFSFQYFKTNRESKCEWRENQHKMERKIIFSFSWWFNFVLCAKCYAKIFLFIYFLIRKLFAFELRCSTWDFWGLDFFLWILLGQLFLLAFFVVVLPFLYGRTDQLCSITYHLSVYTTIGVYGVYTRVVAYSWGRIVILKAKVGVYQRNRFRLPSSNFSRLYNLLLSTKSDLKTLLKEASASLLITWPAQRGSYAKQSFFSKPILFLSKFYSLFCPKAQKCSQEFIKRAF